MSRVVDIPIFPLDTVLFPDGRLPLRIFEQRYVDMTKVCIGEDDVFGVCLILDGGEAGTPAVPHAIGCTARIAEWDVPAPGLFTLLVRGERPFRILERRVQRDGLIRAQVELDAPPDALRVPGEYRGIALLLEQIIDRVGAEHFPAPPRLDDSAWVCHRLAEVLPLALAARQQLLEMRNPTAKLDLLGAQLHTLLQAESGDDDDGSDENPSGLK